MRWFFYMLYEVLVVPRPYYSPVGSRGVFYLFIDFTRQTMITTSSTI